MTKRIIGFGLLALLISCTFYGSKAKETAIVKVEFNNSAFCIPMMDDHANPISVSRELTIVENSLNDTILIGYAILSPHYTGKLKYMREGTILLDDEMLSRGEAKTDSLCFEIYNGKKAQGKIVIEYSY